MPFVAVVQRLRIKKDQTSACDIEEIRLDFVLDGLDQVFPVQLGILMGIGKKNVIACFFGLVAVGLNAAGLGVASLGVFLIHVVFFFLIQNAHILFSRNCGSGKIFAEQLHIAILYPVRTEKASVFCRFSAENVWFLHVRRILPFSGVDFSAAAVYFK